MCIRDRLLYSDPQVALKAGIEADEVFLLGDSKVANVCVAPLKGRDRAVEKAGNMPIGPDKDRTKGPAIAWVHRLDYCSMMHPRCTEAEVRRLVRVVHKNLQSAAVQ